MKVTVKERRFPSATGLTDIRVRMWIPEEPLAALQITHGMAEHIDRYESFSTYLAQNGVLVYGMDNASHGKSIAKDGIRGYFGKQNGWDALLQDMRTLYDSVKPNHPAIPFILMGHSMGSFMARAYASRDGKDFDAFIFSGTAGKNNALPIANWLAKREIAKTGGDKPSALLHKLSIGEYNKAFKNPRTDCDWLSRDEAAVDRYVADEACGYPFTACGMLDLFTGLREIGSKNWAKKVPNRPILMISGACDPVGSMGKGVRQVEGWLRSTGHSPEVKLYENGRHEMLNELNKEEVYGDILLFLNTVEAMGER